MLFNSYIFLIFLPVVWIGYFGLNQVRLFKVARFMLIIASFVFYGYADYRLCFLLMFSILANFGVHVALRRENSGQAVKRLLFVFGLLINLGLLFYFKYLDFTLENLNRFLHAGIALRNIVLPLGISFYTFQQLSFIVDSYYGRAGKYSFSEYCLFVSFFPQLVAGPIGRHQEMIPQFGELEKRRIRFENLLSGMEYFIIGFSKKVLVADSFAGICNAGYDNLKELSSFSAILTILAFTLQIYFDFSGYCDMALGLGKLFNIDIPVNFDSPYKAASIAEFWKRWHITLTAFLTTYIYIPLGGNRKGTVRTCVNVILVFALSGLWHGAAWTFVLWGLLHGAAMVVYRLGQKQIDRLPRGVLRACTFIFVSVAWVFFRAEFFRQPWYLFKQAIVGGAAGIHGEMVRFFCEKSMWKLTLERIMSGSAIQIICQAVMTGWFAFWILVCVKFPSSHDIVGRKIRKTGYYIFLSALFAASLVQLSQVSEFIYFNF